MDSDHNDHATRPSGPYVFGQEPSGLSISTLKGSWIMHLDASFKYSRHTRGGIREGASHVQFPCTITCGVVVPLSRYVYLYY